MNRGVLVILVMCGACDGGQLPGAMGPVTEPVAESAPALPPEPDQSIVPPTVVPEQTPVPKQSRRKKGKAQ